MSKQPFLIFPWQRAFLPDLADAVQRMSGDKPGNALIVIPNQRPWRYIVEIFKKRDYCGLLPKTMPFSELVALWREPSGGKTKMIANPLDQAALLHKCIAELARDDAALEARFANMDMARFLPWGMLLASLLEELFVQGKEASDLAHLEGEVAPPAAALLGALGRICRSWRKLLDDGGLTTPGLEQFLAAKAARDASSIPPHLLPGPDRPIFLAGFSTLSGTEDVILRALWQAGAHICLHADPALLGKQEPHWACAEQASWLRRWQARAEAPLQLSKEEAQRQPKRKFFAGYDLHSQLEAMAADLERKGDSSTAVVLTESSLLLPVLHHLPEKEVNVSMGYPLTRSPLFQLVDALFRLNEGCTEDGLYYWRDLLHVLRHPYLNMLEGRTEDGETFHLRDALRGMESLVRNGSRYVDLPSCLAECQQKLPPRLGRMLQECLAKTIQALAQAATTAGLAQWLDGMRRFLLAHGGDIWRRFPLDAEALYRLMHDVAPQLRQNALAEEIFPPPMLYGIARQLLEHERIAFEADPLDKLQVLGMLETRLLHFERVFIVDATDDALPGNPAQDPLLPDSLRAVLGLPDARSRERVAAYTLHRLCASAKETYFYWQEGVSRSALFDGKKLRSRFVEEFIWDVEKQAGKLLKTGVYPLRAAVCEVRQKPGELLSLNRTPELHAAMTRFLQKPLSASTLDVYLKCPLRFVWQYLCRLAPRKEVNEGDDPAAVGDCLHAALHDLFAPYIGKKVSTGDITEAQALAYFRKAFEDANLRQQLTADACLMLEVAAPPRLREFLKHQPAETHIVALEQQIRAELSLAGRSYPFTGRIDRLDRRDGLLHVLDYKTGAIKKPVGKRENDLWTDDVFFEEATAVCALTDNLAHGASASGEILERLEAGYESLGERLGSTQLPVYVALLEAQAPGAVGNAALVELRCKGEEHPLFDGLVDEELPAARAGCNLALALLLRHMEHAPRFEARQDDHCRWCPYASLCSS